MPFWIIGKRICNAQKGYKIHQSFAVVSFGRVAKQEIYPWKHGAQ